MRCGVRHESSCRAIHIGGGIPIGGDVVVGESRKRLTDCTNRKFFCVRSINQDCIVDLNGSHNSIERIEQRSGERSPSAEDKIQHIVAARLDEDSLFRANNTKRKLIVSIVGSSGTQWTIRLINQTL